MSPDATSHRGQDAGTSPGQPHVERVVAFRPRSILAGLLVVLGVVAAVGFIVLAQAGLTLIAIALFFALALDPAVNFFQRRGLRRSLAVGAVFAITLVVVALLGLVFIPPLVDEISKFIDALPGLVADLTKGHGPLGFLERDYQVVERVRDATSGANASDLTGEAGPVLGVVKSAATTVVGIGIIAFLTLFMLLEGPDWRRRTIDIIPDKHRPAAVRVGSGIYRAVSGFVIGNLLASFLAGVVATVILLVAGVPFALPLGLFVVIIELVPYIGPLVATLLLTAVSLTQGVVPGLVVLGLLLAYHLVEGHTLRPLIYGRALRLSPLAVLIAILLGTEVAGILGALAAIPVAGSVQVVITELLEQRAAGGTALEDPAPADQ